MSTVTLWNVASFGWVCQSDYSTGLTTVSTWTRDDSVLVLVVLGEAEVQAAVLDGQPLALDDVLETIASDDRLDDPVILFERAQQHAGRRPDRVGTELVALFRSAAKTARMSERQALGGPVIPMAMRAALFNLALAVLSTPNR